jgi:peptide/nickel transport system permease protein
LLRFIVRRLAFGLVTLWLLSVVAFVGAQVLPGSPARAMLGPYASPDVVDALNEQLGYNRPILVRYVDWLVSSLQGDFGQSHIYQRPVVDLIVPALLNSLRLTAVTLAIVIPVSLLGGVYAAYHRGRLRDRIVTVGGMTLTVIPEFVTGILLILVLGIWLGALPISATPPAGAGIIESIQYLILPALALMASLFGYIARVARAGTIEVLASDYTRTAIVKGVSGFATLRRHVLPNALLPTIIVIATQIGYLVGGLVVIERLFNYQGLGLLIFNAGQRKDFAILQAAVMLIGLLYLAVTLAADLLQVLLNPRLRARVSGR